MWKAKHVFFIQNDYLCHYSMLYKWREKILVIRNGLKMNQHSDHLKTNLKLFFFSHSNLLMLAIFKRKMANNRCLRVKETVSKMKQQYYFRTNFVSAS